LDDNLAAGVVHYEVRIWELPDVWTNNPDVVINTFPLIAPSAESAVGVRTLTWGKDFGAAPDFRSSSGRKRAGYFDYTQQN
jgi:hypothetical protein